MAEISQIRQKTNLQIQEAERTPIDKHKEIHAKAQHNRISEK